MKSKMGSLHGIIHGWERNKKCRHVFLKISKWRIIKLVGFVARVGRDMKRLGFSGRNIERKTVYVCVINLSVRVAQEYGRV